MSAVVRLIKAKTISFTEELLSNYNKLGLNETECIVLILLNRKLDNQNNILSIEELQNKMSISIDELSNVVIGLVNKDFIAIDMENAVESFSVDGAIEQLAKVLDNDSNNTLQDRQDLLSQIVLYIETTYAKPVSPADLMIINNWIDLGYSYEDIKKAVLESLKAKKMHLRYADAILANRTKQTARETVEYDEDIKKMLDAMYVKK